MKEDSTLFLRVNSVVIVCCKFNFHFDFNPVEGKDESPSLSFQLQSSVVSLSQAEEDFLTPRLSLCKVHGGTNAIPETMFQKPHSSQLGQAAF